MSRSDHPIGSRLSSFIRGSARTLSISGLRRARAKLSRILARLRAHTTVAVEMIDSWQQQQRQQQQRQQQQLQSQPERFQRNLVTGQSTALQGDLSVNNVDIAKSELAVSPATHLETSTTESAVPLTSAHEGHAMHALDRGGDATFLWLGWDYLLKMATDLAFLPLPIDEDPLLLRWWR